MIAQHGVMCPWVADLFSWFHRDCNRLPSACCERMDGKVLFSDMVKDRPLHSSWDIKMKGRQEKKMEKRERREDNLRRRLENERKAEIVQVISNPAKLKRARKKQLRNIEKRDTLMMSKAGKRMSQKKTAPSRDAAKKKSAAS
ncbi:PREDICTED: coiled-coil domain-containing protein 86 [Nanorana parkeri]|uniref:coiled-coil domain-containing protein 86 n=1 Tax=Nanorana parkeri TaxID=125878 RepID=UPI0008544601|nr:PREDICTED: coiled-coil domain-containing protein 86 [Nanorana parkeri]